MQDKRRLAGADFIRSVACIMVVARHLAIEANLDTMPNALRAIVTLCLRGQIGVCFFFVLSGYLLARPFWQAVDAGEPMPSLRTYTLRRIARIVPAFWLALTVTLFLSLKLFGNARDSYTFIRYFAGMFGFGELFWITLFPVEINGPLWSIGFEISSYVILPIVFYLIFCNRLLLRGFFLSRSSWFLIMLVALAGHFLWIASIPVPELYRGISPALEAARQFTPRYNVFGFFSIFAVGSIAAGLDFDFSREDKYTLFTRLVLLIVIVAVPNYIVSSVSREYHGYRLPYHFPIAPLMVASFLLILSSHDKFDNIFNILAIRLLSRISFGIYVWHALLIAMLRNFIFTDAYNSYLVWLYLVLATVLLTLIIAVLSYYFLELPFMRWAKRFEVADTKNTLS